MEQKIESNVLAAETANSSSTGERAGSFEPQSVTSWLKHLRVLLWHLDRHLETHTQDETDSGGEEHFLRINFYAFSFLTPVLRFVKITLIVSTFYSEAAFNPKTKDTDIVPSR